MKSTLTAAVIAALLTPVTHADTLFGLYASAGVWNAGLAGDFNSSSGTEIDPDSTLGIDTESSTVWSVAIEHPFPMMPNVRIRHTDLSYSDTTSLATPVNFQDKNFSGRVTSDIQLSHLDGTMYYEVLDNLVSLDLGITARIFDGELSLRDADSAEALTLDPGLPMLYVNAQFDLPFSGLYAGAEMNNYTLSGNTLRDTLVRMGYESTSGVGVEGGYRTLLLSLDDLDDVYSDLNVRGFFVAGTFHF